MDFDPARTSRSASPCRKVSISCRRSFHAQRAASVASIRTGCQDRRRCDVMPVDARTLEQLRQDDLVPFARLSQAGLTSVMPAHVVYPAVDSQPAGFSSRWLQDILRGELGFDGVIFSDDLGMEGAAAAGGFVARADAALKAGCDMVLVCNQPERADEVLAGLVPPPQPRLAERLQRMVGQGEAADWQAVLASADFAIARAQVAALAMPKDAMAGPAVGEVN